MKGSCYFIIILLFNIFLVLDEAKLPYCGIDTICLDGGWNSHQDTTWWCNDLPSYIEPDSGWQVDSVVIVARHGDRSPNNVLPNQSFNKSPWICSATNTQRVISSTVKKKDIPTSIFQIEISFSNEICKFCNNTIWHGNCTLGQLTLHGANQHFLLGSYFRNIYINQMELLPDILNNSLIYARADEIWRTQQSVDAFLQGLYPKQSRQSDKVIPIYIVPRLVDDLDGNTDACPKLAQLQLERTTTPEYQQHLKNIMPLLQRLTHITNTSNDSRWDTDCHHWHDVFATIDCHGMNLPCGPGGCISQDDANYALAAGTWERNYYYNGKENIRLGIGALIEEILTRMESNRTLFSIFLGHDGTLFYLLHALNISTDGQWPPYAGNIVIERLKSTNELRDVYAVRIFYNGILREGLENKTLSWKEWSSRLRDSVGFSYPQDCLK